MKIVVLKFGGTSVGSIQRIKKVCKIITSFAKKKYKVIVVSSAMGGVTNDLINKSKIISKNFSQEEYDVLVSSGEQISCSLIAGKLVDIGYKSKSLMGWQIPIFTKGNYSSSRIIGVHKRTINNMLRKGEIPIIAGFQGINFENRVTTLGRGGSDATAIMLAKFFKAEKCIIFTDVEGVYTTDPNTYHRAKKIKIISYEEMLEMASLGAKVMQPISIQDARLNRVNINVKSSFLNRRGTLITKRKNVQTNKIIRGITYTKNDAKISLLGVKDRPGVAASIFKPLSSNSINVDMVVQNISSNKKETDLTFTVKSEDFNKTEKLTKKKINIMVISTSEIKISVLISKKNIKKAIEILHKEFNLEN